MPLTKAEAQRVTWAFVRDYPGALELTYKFRENTTELYGPRAAEVPKDMKGGYVSKPTEHNGRMYRGQVHVPLGNIRDADDLLVTLRHEVLGHYGINTFAPTEKRAVLDGLIASIDEPTMKPLWDDINRRYAGLPLDVRAEEVFCLYCEGITPSHHVGHDQVQQRGQKSFTETCVARSRPMSDEDLHAIACMVAQGLHDRSRTQQTFPQINELFRRDENMEPKKPFHQVVAEKLIEQLKSGTAPWQRPWEPGQPNAYLPFNPTTGKRYRGINAIHLMAQGRSDSRWMTYKQAAAVGAQVRRGEKGTLVQYWKFSEEQNKLDENGRPVLDENGKPVKETVMLERPRVFFATVFNAEQIDGLPPLTPPKEQTWNAIERAERILKASGAKITHVHGDQAFYRLSTDSITLPERGQFASADRYYATALHELGHWTGHPSRLNRDLANPFGSEAYAKEELRAEIASMILGDELGIGHDPGQHAAYVASWIKVLQDEPMEVFRAAADAEKIHDYVMAFEQKQVQEQHPEAFFLSYELRHWDTGDIMPKDWQGIAKTIDGVFFYVGQYGGERSFRALRATTFDQAKEEAAVVKALAVDIGEVLNNQDVSQAFRNRALFTVGDVTGHDPERFYEVAHNRLSAVFDSNPDERKGLAQAFVEKAEQLYQQRTAVADMEANMTPNLKAELLADQHADEARIRNDHDQKAQQQPQAEKAERRRYIDVPYKEKDEAKALGARWDRWQQSWYIPPGVDPAPFAKWAPAVQNGAATQENTRTARVYLAVPYEQRQQAKAAGALWDKTAKSWYVGPKGDMEKLARWLPENVPAQQAPAMTPREEFAEAMRSAGLLVQGEHPIMDGKKHRVPVEGGKKGALDGFYVGHLDGHPAGRIINNKTGADIKWKSKGYSLSEQEKARLQAEAAEKMAQRAAEQARAHEATAQRVGRQMADLVPIEKPTPYLQAKGIKAHAGVFTDREGQKTYIPAYDASGKQWTMQYIHEDGTKRFAKDSKKEGCFHPIGGMEALAAAPVLVISEGYATAAQVAEAVGHATVAAFDSGNLEAVAKALHAKFPDKPVIIAGDDDRHLVMTHGNNPGRAKAEAAAAAVGGKAIFPIFAPGENTYPPELPPITPKSYKTHLQAEQRLADAAAGKVKLADGEADKLKASMLSEAQVAALSRMKQHTDFNDLAHKSELGLEGVRRQLDAAVSQAREEQQRRQEQKQVEKQQQQQLERRPRRVARIG